MHTYIHAYLYPHHGINSSDTAYIHTYYACNLMHFTMPFHVVCRSGPLGRKGNRKAAQEENGTRGAAAKVIDIHTFIHTYIHINYMQTI